MHLQLLCFIQRACLHNPQHGSRSNKHDSRMMYPCEAPSSNFGTGRTNRSNLRNTLIHRLQERAGNHPHLFHLAARQSLDKARCALLRSGLQHADNISSIMLSSARYTLSQAARDCQDISSQAGRTCGRDGRGITMCTRPYLNAQHACHASE